MHRPRLRPRLVHVLLIVVLAVITGACGVANGSSSGDVKNLVIGTTQIPRTLNPAVQSGIATASPGAQLFASPVRFTDSFDPKPYLAKSWDFSRDKRTLTLHLVDNATFHDGTPITSEDVAFSLDVVKENHPFGQALFGTVKSVDTPDDLTVVIHLTQPTPAIMIAMSPQFLPVMPKHVYDGENMQTTPLNTSDLVGSGPYKVEEYDDGRKLILEKNDDFFMPGEPKLDHLAFRFFPDESSMLLALDRDEITMTLAGSPTALQQVKGMDDVTVADRGYEGLGNLNWVDVNTKNEYLKDVRVRRALMYGMDVDAIVKQLHQGIGRVNRGPIGLDSPFYSDVVDKYPHDVDQANRLLDQAGFPADADGTRFSLDMMYIPGGDTIGKNVAEMLRQQWREIGVDLNLVTNPDFPTWGQRVANYKYDLTMDNVWNWGDPTIGVARTYGCENIRPGIIWANMSQFCDRAVDKSLADGASAPGEGERAQAYQRFQDQVTDDVPVLWMEELLTFNAYRSNVTHPPNGIWGSMSPLLETSVE